jgi:predicted nucleic acid-binding protein
MKRSVVVDTNVILRFLLADHPEHFRQAAALMADIREGKVQAYVPESVLAECVYVLLKFYEVPKGEIVAKLEGLLGYRGITGENVPRMSAALRLFASRNISSVDAIVFSIAEANGWQLETFDRQLQKLRR